MNVQRSETAMLAEQPGDRVVLVREAGWGKVSWFSVFAGILTAYGAVVLVLGAVSGVLSAAGVDSEELSNNEWRRLGIGAAAVAAVVLLASYWIGGYVAGRMASRAGMLHGALVFVFGVLVLVAVVGIAHLEDGTDVIVDRLDSLGVPTSGDEWADIGTFAGIAAFAGMAIGGLTGGRAGERWHGRLARRAADPEIGPEAELRAEAEERRREAQAAAERARRAEVEARSITPVDGVAWATDSDGEGDTDGERDQSSEGFIATSSSTKESTS